MSLDPQILRFKQIETQLRAIEHIKQEITTTVDVPYNDEFWANLSTYKISPRSAESIKINTEKLISLILSKSDTAILQEFILYLASHITSTEVDVDLLSNAELAATTNSLDTSISVGVHEDVALTPRAQEMSDATKTELMKKSSIYWGPAFAVLLMRLEKRTPETTIQKMRNLSENLSRLYPGKNITCPKFDSELWLEYIRPLHNISYNEPAKNAIYIGMIEAYNRVGVSNNTMGLLDFLILQALRYTGMIMITLTAQIKDALKCPDYEIMSHTLSSASIDSWSRYAKLLESYLIKPEAIQDDNPNAALLRKQMKDKRWMYSREFRSGVFQELSYPKNSYTCNILAAILDYTSSENYNINFRGPVVKGLTELRKVNPSEYDYDLAFVAYQSLRERYLTKPLGDIASDMKVKALERKKQREQLQQVGEDPEVQRMLEEELFNLRN